LFIASIGASSAFVVPSAGHASSSLLDNRQVEMDIKPITDVTGTTPQRPNGQAEWRKPAPRKSESIPFLNVKPHMDGSMAGDVGFDPLGFADTKASLLNMREAEVKHARLAMLAAAGWPLSELFDRKIAELLSLEPAVNAANQAPSVLNGGMGKISPFYWGFCIVFAGAIETLGLLSVSKKKGYFPGNYGFDPFRLYPGDERGQKWMQTAEIKNGRLAMLAITGFCFQELVTHVAVIDQTPLFFKPITEVLQAQVPDFVYPEDVVDAASTAAADSITSSAPAAVVDVAPPVVEAITDSVKSITEEPAAVPSVSDAVTDMFSSAAPSVDAPPAVVPPSDVSEELANAKERIAQLEELTNAKLKIAELESKLSTISDLTR